MSKFIRVKEIEKGWLAINVDHIICIGEEPDNGIIELSTMAKLKVFQTAKEIMQLIEEV